MTLVVPHRAIKFLVPLLCNGYNSICMELKFDGKLFFFLQTKGRILFLPKLKSVKITLKTNENHATSFIEICLKPIIILGRNLNGGSESCGNIFINFFVLCISGMCAAYSSFSLNSYYNTFTVSFIFISPREIRMNRK